MPGTGFLAAGMMRVLTGVCTFLFDSKPFVDSGPRRITGEVNVSQTGGDVTLDTTNNILNEACAYFNGKAYIRLNPGSDDVSWSITGNFLIHGWARVSDAAQSYYTIFDYGRFEGIMLRPGSDGDNLRIFGASYSLMNVFPLNTWVYYAVARENNTISLYTATHGSTTATIRVSKLVPATAVVNQSNLDPILGASRHSGFGELFLGQMSNFEVRYPVSSVNTTSVPFFVL